MSAKYLIRFDDICPTMPWAVWDKVEKILDEFGISPILAVVPDNHDPLLKSETARDDFWYRVREWQRKGWTIGLHGYKHEYVSKNAGILGISANSEFSGLPMEEQLYKIKEGLKIFQAHAIDADIWIAPSHSFDEITLEVLRASGVNCLSDGFFLFPGLDRNGMFWMPQQIWRFRPMPQGVWTVCYHIAEWSQESLDRFRTDVISYLSSISSFPEMKHAYAERQLGIGDKITSFVLSILLRFKRQWCGMKRVYGD